MPERRRRPLCCEFGAQRCVFLSGRGVREAASALAQGGMRQPRDARAESLEDASKRLSV